MSEANIKEAVKEKYGKRGSPRDDRRQLMLRCNGRHAALAPIRSRPISTTAAQADQIPEEAMLASLGCGNPTALAKLNPGETVLDLGSGGGIDVLLSAGALAPTAKPTASI